MEPGHPILDRLARLTRSISGLFWALVIAALGLMVLYVLAGAFDPAASLAWSTFVIVLVVLWAGHTLWLHRRSDEAGSDPRMHRDRERRGF